MSSALKVELFLQAVSLLESCGKFFGIRTPAKNNQGLPLLYVLCGCGIVRISQGIFGDKSGPTTHSQEVFTH